MKTKLYQILKYLIILKTVFILIRAFGQFVHPHIIRQTDTMGVALRYWMRWVIEEPSDFSFIPAVLTSGDYRGIQTMEFPFYNILLAPSFLFGIVPGRTLAQILSFVIMSGLTLWAYRLWKDQVLAGIRVKLAFPLLLLIGVSSTYFYRFMPDYLSFILVMIGMGYCLEESNPHFFKSFFFITLGLLVKPPAIITLGPFLIMMRLRFLLKSIVLCIIPALSFCLLYYTLGLKYLRRIADQPEYFYTKFRNPLSELLNFLSYPDKILDLLFTSLFGHWLSLPLFLGWVYLSIKQKKIVFSPLFFILVLQIIAIGALDGSHAFIHDYYFIGTSFVCCLLSLRFLEIMPKGLVILFFSFLTIGTVEKMIYEVKPVFGKSLWKECSALKDRNPALPKNKGYVFRSVDGPIPYLGLCFGERQRSFSSEYGFYSKESPIPKECKILDKTESIRLVQCNQDYFTEKVAREGKSFPSRFRHDK